MRFPRCAFLLLVVSFMLACASQSGAAVQDLISQTPDGNFAVKGATTIDVPTAKALFDRGVPFIDVRSRASWNGGHVPGAVNLRLHERFSEAELSKIVRKDEGVVIYCSGPG